MKAPKETPESLLVYLDRVGGHGTLMIAGVPYHIIGTIEDEDTIVWKLLRRDDPTCACKEIQVTQEAGQAPECDCESFTYRPEAGLCKHLRALGRFALVTVPQTILVLPPTYPCPFYP